VRKKKVRSEVLQSVHEAAADLHSIGAIDKETMRRFDRACSRSSPYRVVPEQSEVPAT
jgi:putative transcriptional regulator